MARPGDRKTRSNNRKQMEVICFRVDVGQKAELAARARRLGYASLSAMLKDRHLGEEALSIRDLITISGTLGTIATEVLQLPRLGPDKATALAKAINTRLAVILSRIAAAVAAYDR